MEGFAGAEQKEIALAKEGEKRSLSYSGGARTAIWSYKINHSSSRVRSRSARCVK